MTKYDAYIFIPGMGSEHRPSRGKEALTSVRVGRGDTMLENLSLRISPSTILGESEHLPRKEPPRPASHKPT
jgi:hypothetical protein